MNSPTATKKPQQLKTLPKSSRGAKPRCGSSFRPYRKVMFVLQSPSGTFLQTLDSGISSDRLVADPNNAFQWAHDDQAHRKCRDINTSLGYSFRVRQITFVWNIYSEVYDWHVDQEIFSPGYDSSRRSLRQRTERRSHLRPAWR